jgi:crotonobetainyl-CoA:carnitine CoA-transferase CaiB-like acyl-CoA transferase
MERLGLGYDMLAESNPGLVYCSISGYGEEGPRTNLPGQDLLVQCITGLAMMNGRRDDPPTPVGPPVIDAGTGHLAALAVCAALFERERSGCGQRVTASLTATSLSLQSQEATLYLNTGVQPERSAAGVANPFFVAPYGVYQTADGFVAFAHTSLPDLAAAVGEPRLAGFDSPAAIFEARDEIYQLLASCLRKQSTQAWLELLEPAGFWIAPVLGYETFFEEFGEEFVWDAPVENEAIVRGVAAPVGFGRTPATARTGPPKLGAHTEEVLRDLGYSPEDITRLRSEQAI